MQTLTAPTLPEVDQFEAAFKAALKDIRAAGVKVKQNVDGCCQGCIMEEAMGLTKETAPTTPHLWTFGGQDNKYTWIAGLPFYTSEVRRKTRRMGFRVEDPSRYGSQAKVKRIYLNHGGPDLIAAKTAADAFRAHGITVEWDGTDMQTVTVITPHAA